MKVRDAGRDNLVQSAFDMIRPLACDWCGQIDFDALRVVSCDLIDFIDRPPQSKWVDRNKHVKKDMRRMVNDGRNIE